MKLILGKDIRDFSLLMNRILLRLTLLSVSTAILLKIITWNTSQYKTESELRNIKNESFRERIYDYFVRKVKPHVSETTKISFNKYFTLI